MGTSSGGTRRLSLGSQFAETSQTQPNLGPEIGSPAGQKCQAIRIARGRAAGLRAGHSGQLSSTAAGRDTGAWEKLQTAGKGGPELWEPARIKTLRTALPQVLPWQGSLRGHKEQGRGLLLSATVWLPPPGQAPADLGSSDFGGTAEPLAWNRAAENHSKLCWPSAVPHLQPRSPGRVFQETGTWTGWETPMTDRGASPAWSFRT